MGTRIRSLALTASLLLLAASCTPVETGPETPRPTLETVSTTTPAQPETTTTSTTEPSAGLSMDCPTEFCVVYELDPDARWHDGARVTAQDLQHTIEASRDPISGSPDPGYDLISGTDVIDERTLRVVFSRPYGPWRGLLPRVTSATTSGVGDIGPGTGPFRLGTWVPGDSITVERVDPWWAGNDPLSGAPVGDIAEIRFVFVADVGEMSRMLEAGEVDVIMGRPSPDIVDRITSRDDLQLALAPGPLWEHIDFHHDDPMLTQPWVREAMALAIDRQEIVAATIGLMADDASVLDNTIWMQDTVHYQPHFPFDHDPARAEQLLIDNGCAISRGVYECGGTRMSFRWVSTDDDPERRAIFESVQDGLEAIGVELIGEFRSPSEFVTREFLFGGPDAWQMLNFAWRTGPDPATSDSTYFCGASGELNVNRFCSPEVESAVRTAGTVVDGDLRAALYNRADWLYLRGVAAIPLYQKLTMMAWGSSITGPTPNFASSTDMWNVAAWTGPDSIVVAIPGEPDSLDPVSASDPNAQLVLSTMFYGAFGMDPAHRHLPQLVESVTVTRAGP